MSLRRNVVLKTYATVVDALYSPSNFTHGTVGSYSSHPTPYAPTPTPTPTPYPHARMPMLP